MILAFLCWFLHISNGMATESEVLPFLNVKIHVKMGLVASRVNLRRAAAAVAAAEKTKEERREKLDDL